MRKLFVYGILLLPLFLSTPSTASGTQQGPAADLVEHYASEYSTPQEPHPLYQKILAAKARPDECYESGSGTVGVPDAQGACSRGIPKKNQAYVWGLTRSGNIWLGTAPNTLCMVLGGLMTSLPITVPLPTPFETASFVCEFDKSKLVPPLPGELGDWRPPKIFEYNPNTGELTDRTPPDPLVNHTLGIRSAGAQNGVAMLAGPSLGGGITAGQGAINIFAFSDDGTYLGGKMLAEFSDIRQWVLYEGVLYAAVSSSQGQGRVMRWNGTKADPFNFEVVGRLDIEGANIAAHEGRLFVTTWPNFTGTEIGKGGMAGLWMSPVIPAGGLTGSDNDSWQKVWSASDYEPDPIVASTYLGGALASFDGHLIWGTMHLPFLGSLAAFMLAEQGVIDIKGADNQTSPDDYVATMLGGQRSISVFSGRGFGTPDQRIEILYGEQYLPVYDAAARGYTIAYDAKHRNKMPNPVPRFGPSGIGNFFNTYTWSMAAGWENLPVRKGMLLGTFDWSVVAQQMAAGIITHIGGDNASVARMADALSQIPVPGFGADLFVAKSADEPFILDSNDGAGNQFNYGIRTMLMPEDGNDACAPAYLGMANPFNLAKEGGWELIGIYPDLKVGIVSPAPNETLRGTALLQARDDSPCGIKELTFYLFATDGCGPEKKEEMAALVMRDTAPADRRVYTYSATRAGGANLWSYGLDTLPLPNGAYDVLCRGIDPNGNDGWSGPVPVVIANAQPCTDLDGDGYGDGPGCAGPDCDDSNPAVHINCAPDNQSSSTSSICPVTSSICPVTSSICPVSTSVCPVTTTICTKTTSITPVSTSIGPEPTSTIPTPVTTVPPDNGTVPGPPVIITTTVPGPPEPPGGLVTVPTTVPPEPSVTITTTVPGPPEPPGGLVIVTTTVPGPPEPPGGLVTVPTTVPGNSGVNDDSSVTTTVPDGFATTTTTVSFSECPAEKVLGSGSRELEALRAFRDTRLARSAIGRRLIQLYYGHAKEMNAAFERSPALKNTIRILLEAVAPILKK